MRIVIFGAGAIGSLLGASCAAHGDEVLLVARPGHVAAIQARGLAVEGRRTGTYRMRAEATLPAHTPADVALLTVKSPDLASGAESLGKNLFSPIPVFSAPNGLHVERAILEGLGRAGWPDPPYWLVRGVNTLPATLIAPGVVRYAGEGEILLPGPEPKDPTAPAAIVGELLQGIGIPVRYVAEFEREIWRKALVNAAINPVTAEHGILNGRLLEDPWRGQALELLHEAQRVARLAGILFTDAEAEGDLFRVLRASAGNRSSMLQDVDRGRPTEIAAISGELLAEGRTHGAVLPATERAMERVREKARQRT